MAQFEQKINGKVVKSNLELDRVEGAFVYFTDGSWCNADTGQVKLVGDGFIHISGDPTAPAAERKTVEMKFDPRPLKVVGLYADLEVVPHPEDSIVVTIEGTEAEIKGIEAKESGAYLVVTGGEPSGVNMGATISVTKTKSHGSNIIADLLGGNFNSFSQTIIGSIGNVGPKVTIKVPLATDITVARVHGEVTIGDILGDVSISMETSDDVEIGNTKNCNVTVGGSGAFQIGDVEGNFDITVNGSGDTDVNNVEGTVVALINGRGGIDISGGKASIFDVKNTASGEFSFGGVAHNAKITLGGMGGIEVSETIGDLTISSDGSGDIEISKVGGGKIGAKLNGRGGISIEDGDATLVHIVSNGSGEFEFDGTALDTSLVLTGRGGIDITTINGDLDITTSGSGDIDIDGGAVGNLKVDLSGRGGVSFDGRAVDADLKSTGSGDIDVTFVKNKPSITQRGRGSITVDNWDD